MRTVLVFALASMVSATSLKDKVATRLEARSLAESGTFLETVLGTSCRKNCGEKCALSGKCKDDSCKNDAKNCDRLAGCDWKKKKDRCEGTPITSSPAVAPTSPPIVAPTSPPIVAPTSPPVVAPTSPPVVAPTSPPVVAPTSASWIENSMTLSAYWDCSGQGCDASDSVDSSGDFDAGMYVTPAGYAPQDPSAFTGGAEYGESLWVFGAASNSLQTFLGGTDGLHKCVLLKDPSSLNPDMKVLVMITSQCPGADNAKCNLTTYHIDILAPGYDYPSNVSTANICGDTSISAHLSTSSPYNGLSKAQSNSIGAWNDQLGYSNSTAAGAALCSGLATDFQVGCSRFSSWGWTVGTPGYVYPPPYYNVSTFTGDVPMKVVSCPAQMKTWAEALFTTTGGPADNSFTPADLV